MCGSEASSRYPDKARALESQPGLFYWKFEGGAVGGTNPLPCVISHHQGQFGSAALLPPPTTEGETVSYS